MTTLHNSPAHTHSLSLSIYLSLVSTVASSLAIAWEWLSTVDVPLTLGFQTIPVPQLPASNSSTSQGLNRSSPLTLSLTTQLTPLHWLSLIALLITSRHRSHRKHRSSVPIQLLLSGPHRKHHSSVAVCRPLPSNGRCTVTYLVVAAWWQIYMPQYALTCFLTLSSTQIMICKVIMNDRFRRMRKETIGILFLCST
jgi:hypothetical protein